MKNIKLIVTDMDGTFLNSKYEISPEFPAVYEELKKRNILFIPASGRQMAGITQYFKDIENEIGFIAENGGYVVYQDQELFADQLAQETVAEIVRITREISGAEIVVSAKKNAYYESTDDAFVNYFKTYYTANKKVEDLTAQLNDDVFKIAIYHADGAEDHVLPHLNSFKNDDLEMVVSGKNWVDLMNKKISKGHALSIIQKKLDILPSETMVFGDYMNDIDMLKNSQFSFAMQNAHPDVKKVANYEAESNDHFGVVKAIGEVIRSS